MSWPQYYPENCPPENTDPADVTLYRLVPNSENQNAIKKEFTPFAVKMRHKFGGNCQASGLSSFVTLSECNRVKRKIPRLKNLIAAKAELNDEHGEIMNTPSQMSDEHYTWWVPSEIEEPWLLFESLEDN